MPNKLATPTATFSLDRKKANFSSAVRNLDSVSKRSQIFSWFRFTFDSKLRNESRLQHSFDRKSV